MSEQNLSQWFDLAEQKPWEVGVYEAKYDGLDKIYYSWFNGEQFQSGWYSKQKAKENKNMPSGLGLVPEKWRGLSTNPEVKKKENKCKTMYVVMKAISNSPVASFSNVNAARDYAGRVNFPVRIRRIRFRTPE